MAAPAISPIESSTRRSFAASVSNQFSNRLGSSALPGVISVGRPSATRSRIRSAKFHVINGAADAATERFLSRLDYVSVDAIKDGGWADLKALLGADDRIRAYYLATGPGLFGPLAKRIGAEGLATLRSRIIVEKPIGKDGSSAAAINDVIGAVFLERNIFRIDHYLGKESVQNLMALRFANILLEPCGTTRTLIMCRSPSLRRLALRDEAAITKKPARCGTWSRTI